jgi:hypothetical protein
MLVLLSLGASGGLHHARVVLPNGPRVGDSVIAHLDGMDKPAKYRVAEVVYHARQVDRDLRPRPQVEVVLEGGDDAWTSGYEARSPTTPYLAW